MNLRAFITSLIENGDIEAIAQNTVAQFGNVNRQLLGASLLPEQNKRRNMYREHGIRFRTVIANAGARYSPVQIKDGGQMFGSFLVELGESDIGRQFTGEDYDALLDLLNENAQFPASATLIGWTNTALNMALVEFNEKQRWEAIVDASTVRKGDNGYEETVDYYDPAGHRINAGGTWSDDAYDPWEDIIAMKTLLSDKGYTLNRVVTSQKVVNILISNVNSARRAFRTLVYPTTDSAVNVSLNQVVSLDDLNAVMTSNGMPTFEVYDERYWTQDSHDRFMPDNVMCFFATTGRDVNITNTLDVTDTRFIPSTFGYTALGRPQGELNPGRVIKLRVIDHDKPYHIEGKAWQTSLPVITEPEAMAVIKNIA